MKKKYIAIVTYEDHDSYKHNSQCEVEQSIYIVDENKKKEMEKEDWDFKPREGVWDSKKTRFYELEKGKEGLIDLYILGKYGHAE